MKLFEIAGTLEFNSDNPGGTWLDNKREDNDYKRKNEFGAPNRFGPVTGYFNRSVLLPVKLVAKAKGMRGEQSHVREPDLASLMDVMGKTDQLPLANGKQYAPFIMIDQEGEPWVNEGNHRIMAAVKLGWEYIPIEVRYFTGGEDKATEFSPSKLKAYDTKALAAGFKAGNDFKAKDTK